MKCMNRFLNKSCSCHVVAFIAGILILAPATLFCQQKLLLTDAVKEGLINNYQIRIAKNGSDMVKNNISYGNAGFLPSVTAYSSMDKASLNTKVKVINGSKLDKSSATSTITSAGIKAQWVLFDGVGMFAEYEKLKTLWRLSDLETRITMENTVFGIIMAYSGIIKQKQLLGAWDQRLKVSKFRYFLAQQKLNSGSGTEQELLQAEVVKQADSTEFTKQLAALRKSGIILNQLLATDIDRNFLTEDTISLVTIPGLNELLASGIQMNSHYIHVGEQVKFSQLETKSLRSDLYPKVMLNGSYGFYENESEAAFINYNRYFGPQVGINVSINLFNGLQLRKLIQNSQMNSQNKELFLKDMEQNISALILETYLDYQNQLQSISLAKEGLKLAEKNLSIAKTAFQSGLISSLQIREAQEDCFHASATLINAFYDAKIKETELLMYSGMLLR